MLTNILEQQGFSPMEARVYLVALELGQSPAAQIARKLQENRVTVYSTLQNMVEKHLMLTVMKNKVIHYSAISPKMLLKLVQERADMISEKMPEFLALSTLFNDKPSVQFYEGLEGLKLIYEDTLSIPGSTMKAFLGYNALDKGLKRYLDYVYLPMRIKRKIAAKVLMPMDTKEVKDYAPMDKKDSASKYTELRFVSDDVFQLSNEIVLYGNDRVALIMFGENEMMGLLIQSKMLYTTLVSLFDLTWKREADG